MTPRGGVFKVTVDAGGGLELNGALGGGIYDTFEIEVCISMAVVKTSEDYLLAQSR